MNIIIFIFLFFLYSCNYPDIDTVPKFNLNKTIQEKCDYIEQNMNIEDIEECKIVQVINRL